MEVNMRMSLHLLLLLLVWTSKEQKHLYQILFKAYCWDLLFKGLLFLVKRSHEKIRKTGSQRSVVSFLSRVPGIYSVMLWWTCYDHHHHHNYHHDYHHDYHHHCHDHFHHLTLIFAAVKFTWLRLNESSKQTQLSLHKCLTRRNKSAISNNSLKQTHVRPSLLWKMRAT